VEEQVVMQQVFGVAKEELLREVHPERVVAFQALTET